MSSSSDPTTWYSSHAASLGPVYDAMDPATLHGWLDGLAPAVPGLVLDVSAGTGRDGAWLASQGHDVVAVEPHRAAMRAEGLQRHPGPNLRWVEDCLPALSATYRLGLSFDLILPSRATSAGSMPGRRPCPSIGSPPWP